MNYRYIGILVKIAESVGTLTKMEIPIRQKRVRLVPPDAKCLTVQNLSYKRKKNCILVCIVINLFNI